MRRTQIRYKTVPDRAEENQRLIEAVFAELRAKSPEGIRYLVLRLDDGTFLHLVAVAGDDANPITGLETFKSFQKGVKERWIEPPRVSEAAIVGNYGMLCD